MKLEPTPTIAILRDYTPEAAAVTAEACWAAGFGLVEVPVDSAAEWEALGAVAETSLGRSYGAGTVLSVQDASRAIQLGANVIISPSVDANVIAEVVRLGATPLPGVDAGAGRTWPFAEIHDDDGSLFSLVKGQKSTYPLLVDLLRGQDSNLQPMD